MSEPTTEFETEINEEVIRPLESHLKELLEGGLREEGVAGLGLFFGSCFQEGLEELPLNVPLRNWRLDDINFNKYRTTSKKYTLQGVATWLEGGEYCHYIRLDVERSERHFRYSFKLFSKQNIQYLYVGRTLNSWRVVCSKRLLPINFQS